MIYYKSYKYIYIILSLLSLAYMPPLFKDHSDLPS